MQNLQVFCWIQLDQQSSEAPGVVRRQERTRDPFQDTADSDSTELETLPDTDCFS